MLTPLLVAVGAAVGAPLRYLTDRAVQRRTSSSVPWGTFVVNVLGSLVLGLVIGGAAAGGVPAAVVAALGVGACGAFTTYSTFAHETVRLVGDRSALAALGHALVSVAAGLAAAWAGLLVATAVWG